LPCYRLRSSGVRKELGGGLDEAHARIRGDACGERSGAGNFTREYSKTVMPTGDANRAYESQKALKTLSQIERAPKSVYRLEFR